MALRHQLPGMHLRHLRPWEWSPKMLSWENMEKNRKNMENPGKKTGKTWKTYENNIVGGTEFCKSWDDGYQVIPPETWNLKMDPWKSRFLLATPLLLGAMAVSFRGKIHEDQHKNLGVRFSMFAIDIILNI